MLTFHQKCSSKLQIQNIQLPYSLLNLGITQRHPIKHFHICPFHLSTKIAQLCVSHTSEWHHHKNSCAGQKQGFNC